MLGLIGCFCCHHTLCWSGLSLSIQLWSGHLIRLATVLWLMRCRNDSVWSLALDIERLTVICWSECYVFLSWLQEEYCSTSCSCVRSSMAWLIARSYLAEWTLMCLARFDTLSCLPGVYMRPTTFTTALYHACWGLEMMSMRMWSSLEPWRLSKGMLWLLS